MSNDTAHALAANLRRLRVAARVPLSELARAPGVGRATLSESENGRGNPTVHALAALAAALSVPLVDLLAVAEPAPTTVVRAGHGVAAGDGLERVGRVSNAGGEVLRATLRAHSLLEE